MFFNAALFGSLLLVLAALAVPSAIGTRLQSRDAVADFAGAYFDAGNGTFDRVTAMFTVPTTSGSTWASAVAAIGISCNTTSLFAGVIFTVAPNGRSEYIAWYSDSNRNNFSNITISAGDAISVAVAVSTTSGNVTVENLTNGQVLNKTLTSESLPLCGRYADWVVQEMEVEGPLLNFGTLNYTSARAFGNGKSYTPYYGSNVSLVDMVRNGQTLANASTSRCSQSLEIQYTGP